MRGALLASACVAARLLLGSSPAFAGCNDAAGVLVTNAVAPRQPQLAVSDRDAGAFVVLTGASGPGQVGVFVQHLTGDGLLVPGWTDSGVAAGPVASVSNGSCLPSRLLQCSATP